MDEIELNQIIKTYYNEIFAYVYKQTLDQEQSKDICQDIFLKFVKYNKKYNKEKSSIRTFLYKIATHHLIDLYRSKKEKWHNNILELTIEINDPINILEDMIQEEEISTINNQLNKLSKEEQSVIRLRFYGEYSLNEIASLLKLDLQTVKNRLYNGLKKIKILIKEMN